MGVSVSTQQLALLSQGLTALLLLFLLASGNAVAWVERVTEGGGTHAQEYYLSNSTLSQPLLGCVLGMILPVCPN